MLEGLVVLAAQVATRVDLISRTDFDIFDVVFENRLSHDISPTFKSLQSLGNDSTRRIIRDFQLGANC